MNTPITSLVEVLEEVQQKASFYNAQLQGNEAATRAALIDPVLRALGWDVADPSRVLVERTQTVNGTQLKVDYALLAEGEVRLVVEAKKLGGDLSKDFLQVVNYSFGLQVGDIFITDGSKWRHYHNLTHNNQNPVRELKINVDRLEEIAVYPIQHLDAALIAPETPQIDELAAKIENLEQKIAALEHTQPRPTAQSTSGQSQPPASSPTTHGVLNWEDLQPHKPYEKTKPRWLRLPDGREVAVGGWSTVLIECCRYVLEQHPPLRAQMPVPDSAGKKVALISSAKPPKNRGGSYITVDSSSYWVDTNYPANGTVANVFHILSYLSGSSQTVAIVL